MRIYFLHYICQSGTAPQNKSNRELGELLISSCRLYDTVCTLAGFVLYFLVFMFSLLVGLCDSFTDISHNCPTGIGAILRLHQC